MANDLSLVTLYGSGAVILHSGKDTFRAVDGVLRVPANLVRQAEAAGYKRTRRGDDAPTAVVVAPSEAPPLPPATETHDEKVARYRAEIETRGYTGEAATAILAERLAFDGLVAGGMSEEDAAEKVWGSGEPAEEVPAAGIGGDVGALSADVNAGDATAD